MIGVLLADDQLLVRAGFRALLDAQDDIEVVGEAGDGEEAVRKALELSPDVVLMDIRMPKLDGLAATRQIAADDSLAGTRVVILTTFGLDEYVFEAIRSGASGFLVKDTEPDELIQAVRVVAGGDALLSPAVTRSLIEEFAARTQEPRPSAELDRGVHLGRGNQRLHLGREGREDGDVRRLLRVRHGPAQGRFLAHLGPGDDGCTADCRHRENAGDPPGDASWRCHDERSGTWPSFPSTTRGVGRDDDRPTPPAISCRT